MNDELVYRWNQTVNAGDTVIHLGDVALCGGDPEKEAAFDDVMHRLNGYLHLVGGNHDNLVKLADYFDRTYAVRERSGCILSHIPVHPCQKDRFRLNIHGHLHDNFLNDPWYVCVSVEQHHYAPVPFKDLIKERLAQHDT